MSPLVDRGVGPAGSAVLALCWLATPITAAHAADDPIGPRLLRDCASCPELVVIPAGRFTMGSPDGEEGRYAGEGPQRELRIEQPFALGRYEVTRAEFEAFVDARGWAASGCRVLRGDSWTHDEARGWRDPGYHQEELHPVVCVDRDDVAAYVDWLSAETGKRYRLPSDSEWEYAARAGTTTARFWGDDPAAACAWGNVADRATKGSYAAIRRFHPCDDGYVHTAPVGSFTANPFGLHDMLGNVWEWIEDCWSPSHAGAPGDGEARTGGDCQRRVARGGSWGLAPRDVRSAARNWFDVDHRSSVLGFRVARDLP